MTGDLNRSNRRVALMALAGAGAMLGLAFASVPLYDLFCRATGFGGTPQRADAAPGASAKTITIRFDANVASALGWTFHPAQTVMEVKTGEQALAFYRATNNMKHTVTGTAGFNVSPDTAGAYFNKIECFCFTEQTLKPGETADMPVVFFVDPAIETDASASGIKEITLSYTFYPVDKPRTVSEAPQASGQIAN
jgi:cytochrome c oxidase assembly protein subunit 11